MPRKTRTPLERYVEEHAWFSAGLAALFVIAAVALWYVVTTRFNVCTPTAKENVERLKQTISALDAVADVSIKLSTACVGFGVALLVGLKVGIDLTRFSRFYLLAATIFFIQSALYAVVWRMGVAELWLNNCLELISNRMLTLRYDISFYFFLAGLASTALLVLGAALRK